MDVFKETMVFRFLLTLTFACCILSVAIGYSGCRQSKKKTGLVVDCSHCNFTHIPHLSANTTTLNLNFNKISLLKSGGFRFYSHLKHLYLKGNIISTIETKAFQGLDFLELLDLSGNALNMTESVLKPGIFKGLDNLLQLSIQNNTKTGEIVTEDTQYPDKTLGDLVNLKALQMDGFPRRTFGEGFRKMSQLQNITMSGREGYCNMIILSNTTFVNVANIRSLVLNECGLTHIEMEAFKPLSRLNSLDMSHNDNLTFKILRNASYGLQYTDIKIFKINHIHKTFSMCTELKKGDLEFLSNTRLREFHIDSNKLQFIHPGVIQLFPTTLQTVSAGDNEFTYGPYLFELVGMQNLTSLNISKLRATHDPSAEKSFREHMYAENEKIENRIIRLFDKTLQKRKQTNGNETFDFKKKSVPKINYLSRRSTITKVGNSRHIPVPPNLREVNASDSSLKFSIPSLYLMKNKVEKMDLSNNVLFEAKGEINGMESLEYLDLSWNHCTFISQDTFKHGSSLKALNLRGNLLGLSFHKGSHPFGNLLNLRHLDLEHNMISQISDTLLSELDNLEYLNVQSNELAEFNIETGHMVNLTTLELANNKLTSLSEPLCSQLSARATSMKVFVNLKGNLLRCTCDNIRFLEWLTNSDIKFKYKKLYQCIYQNGTKGRMPKLDIFIKRLRQECKSDSTYPILAGVISMCVLMIMCIFTIALVYRFRWKLRYLYYMSRRKRRSYHYVRLEASDQLVYKYDAFVSYADEDADFVRNKLLVMLEQEFNFKLCIHHRDFIPGRAISGNIVDAIQSSRRTVVVMSLRYLESYWCMYELNMARMENKYSRKDENVTFLIMLENIPTTALPLEVLELTQNQSYIEYPDDEQGDVVFWATLQETLKEQ